MSNHELDEAVANVTRRMNCHRRATLAAEDAGNDLLARQEWAAFERCQRQYRALCDNANSRVTA